MKAINKNSSIKILWKVFRGNNKISEDFHSLGSDIHVFIVGCGDTYTITPVINNIVEPGYDVLEIDIPAGKLIEGAYDIKAIWEKNGGRNILTSSRCGIFGITDSTEEAPVKDEEVKIASFVESYGRDGMSAYEIAVMRGLNEGIDSEVEWISQETKRQAAEKEREAAEKERKSAESKRNIAFAENEADRQRKFEEYEEKRQQVFEENEEKRWESIPELEDYATKGYVDEKASRNEQQIIQNRNVINSLDESKAEKSTVTAIQNTLNTENPPVAKPTISVNWIAHKDDGTELDSVPNEGGTASSPIVEKGYKMRYEATYSWRSAEGYQDPTSVDTANSDWKDESTPPGSGVSSESIVLDSPTVTSDKTLEITLQAKEVGLKTNSDGYLVPASGFVKSSASVGVTFRNRLYYGKTRDLEITSSTLSNLEYKKLRPKENLTLQNLSTVSGEYYVYAFPIRLSKIAANGLTVWDVKIQGPQGFNEYTTDIINAAGVKIKYYVYRTVQSGSLSNTTLSFTY